MMNYLLKLWNDDAGSVIAAEYLALAGIVALGGVSGLEAVRSATVSESQEVANGIRSINQNYRIPTAAQNAASTDTAATDDHTHAGVCKLNP